MKRRTPSEVEQKILWILAIRERRLKSREITAESGLSANTVQGACAWLRENQYVSCQFKLVKQQAWGKQSNKSLAFWSLTEKGHSYVATSLKLGIATH